VYVPKSIFPGRWYHSIRRMQFPLSVLYRFKLFVPFIVSTVSEIIKALLRLLFTTQQYCIKSRSIVISYKLA